jgi:hypothetical protein
MVALDVLMAIAEKLRQSQKLTAVDLLHLYRVAQALAKASGYEDIKDTDISLDALEVWQKEAQEKNENRINPA